MKYAASFKSGPSDLEIQWKVIHTMIDCHGGKKHDIIGDYENSLLYYAVLGCNHVVVEGLLKRGVDPNLRGFLNFNLLLLFYFTSFHFSLFSLLFYLQIFNSTLQTTIHSTCPFNCNDFSKYHESSYQIWYNL